MSFSVLVILLMLTISEQLNQVTSLNILGIFPYQGKTHFFVFEPFLKELAARGHNVTVISYFPQNQTIKNYHDISLEGKVKVYESVFEVDRSYKTIFKMANFLVTSGTDNCISLLENQDVHKLINSKITFDVTVLEQFNSDCSLGVAYKFGAPVIGMTSHTTMPWHFDRFGIPSNPAFVSFQFLEGGTKPTLFQRVERTILRFITKRLFKAESQDIDQKTLAKYFNDIPPLEELGSQIKLLLVYTNPVLFGSTLLPANVIEVNGYHVAKPRPLPTDVQKFIDESEHGVIFVSFGSMLQAKSTPISKMNAIVNALSELPQRVIWKWDDETLPGNPKNIFVSKWLPQNDILAHPNVVAFYSHCGLLSTTEAVYHGVPIVGMPVFGDQPANAAAVEESGFGVQIPIADLTKENLLSKFKTVLDPMFREKVKQRSKAWHDRPLSAMDTAIFWTEYIANHRNISLKTAAAETPLYQYIGLDVIGILLLIILLFVYIITSIIKLLLKICCRDILDTSRQSNKKKL